MDAGQVGHRLAVGIGISRAPTQGIPALEGVAVTGKAVGGEGSLLIVHRLYRRGVAPAVVGGEVDGVLVGNPLAVQGLAVGLEGLLHRLEARLIQGPHHPVIAGSGVLDPEAVSGHRHGGEDRQDHLQQVVVLSDEAAPLQGQIGDEIQFGELIVVDVYKAQGGEHGQVDGRQLVVKQVQVLQGGAVRQIQPGEGIAAGIQPHQSLRSRQIQAGEPVVLAVESAQGGMGGQLPAPSAG